MDLQWKKRMRSAGWLSLALIGAVLLVAGVAKKNHKKCVDVKVEVTGVNRHIFIDEKEVLKLLNATDLLIGKPIEEINLQVLESRLEKYKWIRNAELFFDNNEVLQVQVEEREPVARIFTIGGNSFYIDSSGSHLPLSDKLSIRVPMFTNFPAEGTRLRSRDSVLVNSIKHLATFIQADSFWNAQVAQIDITPDRTFEMVPTIGNHIVALGKGDDVEQKFGRLYTFYKQVWTKVGLEKYSKIDVQYKGQVVATRRGEGYKSIDSSKAREAFIKLLSNNKPDTIDEHAIKVKPVVDKAIDDKVEVGNATSTPLAPATSELKTKVRSEIAKAVAKDKKANATAANTNKDKEHKDTVKDDEENTTELKPKAVMKKKATQPMKKGGAVKKANNQSVG